MFKPQSSEVDALRQSSDLLKFIGESGKDLPETSVTAITAAWKAEQEDQWSPEISTRFWIAYNALCSLIKPVSIDSISANFKPADRPKWMFWPPLLQPHSLSRRAADRYLALMMLLLVIAVVLGFLASAATSLNADNLKLIETANNLAEKISKDVDALDPKIGAKMFSDSGIPEDVQKSIKLVQQQFHDLDFLLDQMLLKTQMLTRLLHIFGLEKFNFDTGNLQPDISMQGFKDGVVNYYLVRRDVYTFQQKASIITGILNSTILPIVLGMMGACAFVVRLISDQIKDTTFSTTSPIRHLMRVALGALAGVVIGFGGIFTGVGISSAALSFVAGYAIEPVFASLDNIADKFKRNT